MADGEPDVSRLLGVAEAIKILDATPVRPRVIRRALADAAGLRLAQDLAADRNYPPFAKSLMDGYAIRAADVKAVPAVLRVVGEVAAGAEPARGIGPGEAMAVMTGAPMPPGADGVVPVEDVGEGSGFARSGLGSGAQDGGGGTVQVRRAPAPTRYVAARGSDCAAGRAVLARGTLLGPAQIAVAATIGAGVLDVFDAPHVAVLGTGDELIPADGQPRAAQIRNSNNPMLVALLRRAGCRVTDLGTVPDDPDAIRAAVQNGLAHDALFVTGGMSMGEYDYVPRILQELGLDLKITKLRIKPGKPFVFGVGGEEGSGFGIQGSGGDGGASSSSSASPNPEPRTPNPPIVFGLPGNPVSAFVCTVRLATRVLSRLAGGEVQEKWVSGRLESGLGPNGPREFYQPVVRTVPPGRVSAQSALATIRPLTWKGSADLFTLAQANALLVRGENEPPVPEGTMVRVLEI